MMLNMLTTLIKKPHWVKQDPANSPMECKWLTT
jgi:hypothetical protein